MDQNNYNQSNVNGAPQPTYGQPQQPAPQYQPPQYAQQPAPQYQPQYSQQPVYVQQAPAKVPTPAASVQCSDDAFGKGLAATIIAWLPIASIIAIVLGSGALGLVEQAEIIAKQYRSEPCGKNTAAKILGKIGKIGGIAMTIFWGVYFLLIFAIIGSL